MTLVILVLQHLHYIYILQEGPMQHFTQFNILHYAAFLILRHFTLCSILHCSTFCTMQHFGFCAILHYALFYSTFCIIQHFTGSNKLHFVSFYHMQHFTLNILVIPTSWLWNKLLSVAIWGCCLVKHSSRHLFQLILL